MISAKLVKRHKKIQVFLLLRLIDAINFESGESDQNYRLWFFELF